MAKTGDTVRFLNSTGGGKITKIEGQLAYVDDGGFETPVLLKELVVVMPAGHEPSATSGKMFDQNAYDAGKATIAGKGNKIIEKNSMSASGVAEAMEEPVVETDHGEKPDIVLAFEPTDVRRLDVSEFAAVLVNDSNYRLDFVFLRRGDGDRGWTLEFRGSVLPNESIDLAVLTHETLCKFERIALQGVFSKQGKEFVLQPPLNINRRLDLTKFHKFHCFRPGVYFDSPVMEIPLINDGVSAQSDERKDTVDKLAILSEKNKVEIQRRKHKPVEVNPRKVLPLVEVDLHIGELLDTTAGMEPKDILGVQLDAVRRHMNEHKLRIGQKIVFIHGKGEGVLRKEVLSLLKKEYPKAELQDASFREYGFGATLVTVH